VLVAVDSEAEAADRAPMDNSTERVEEYIIMVPDNK
jgi:hypothetical protein